MTQRNPISDLHTDQLTTLEGTKEKLLTILIGTVLLEMGFRLSNQATLKDFWAQNPAQGHQWGSKHPLGWWNNTLISSASHPNKLAPHSLRSHNCSEIAHNTLGFEWLHRLNTGQPVFWKVILLPSAFMCGEPRKTEFLCFLFQHAWVDKHMEGASQFWRPTNMNYILRVEKWLKKLQIQFLSIVQVVHACVKLLKVVL